MTDDELRELKNDYGYGRNDCRGPIHSDVHQLIAEIERLQNLVARLRVVELLLKQDVVEATKGKK